MQTYLKLCPKGLGLVVSTATSLNPSLAGGLSVWRLHVLPVLVGVLSGCSGIVSQSKDTQPRGPDSLEILN